MQGVRVIELPKCTTISSGISTEPDPFAEEGLLMGFNRWWSTGDKGRREKFSLKDLIWYDRETKGTIWWYAVDEIPPDTGGFEAVDFKGGMYAAAI